MFFCAAVSLLSIALVCVGLAFFMFMLGLIGMGFRLLSCISLSGFATIMLLAVALCIL